MSENPLKIAVIDLGSNTARLIVMQAVPGYAYRLVDQIREVVRLRQGMDQNILSDGAIERTLSTLRLFRRFCDSIQVDVILATATSAVREAANGPEFVARVELETGFKLDVLAGDKEAYYGVLGVLNEIPLEEGIVLDIGGGSIQLSEVRNGRFIQGEARSLGSLALTERFIQNDPASEDEVNLLLKEIKKQIASITWLEKAPRTALVGLGGTIRNLARIEAARSGYPLSTLHGFELTLSSVETSIQQFRSLPLGKRQKIVGLQSDRADIILPGALVVKHIMRDLGLHRLLLSVSGLREGVFLQNFWSHLPYPVMPDVRRFSVLNLARNYDYNKNHVNHVRYLCIRIFEQLEPLHKRGADARRLLEAAALLHDIGTIIGYDGHDRHSQTLIEYNGLAGYTPREIALIALLCRYHRKGDPDIEAYKKLLDEEDHGLLFHLVPILRLAEFLERGRTGNIDDVLMTWDQDTLRMTLIADEYPFVEVWQAQRNAVALVEKAYGRTVLIDSIAAPADWS